VFPQGVIQVAAGLSTLRPVVFFLASGAPTPIRPKAGFGEDDWSFIGIILLEFGIGMPLPSKASLVSAKPAIGS
jgi:hypothetical protein